MAFNRDNRSGGGRDFGRRSFDGGRGRDDRQMFKTTCSNCGRECEVPFKPTGSKPVYCRDCFRTMGGGSDSRRTDDRGPRNQSFDNGNRGSSQPQYREEFEALNAKLDKILTFLNREKSTEAQKVVTKPQVEDAKNGVESAEPVKKKIRAKKLVPTATESPTQSPTE